MRTLLVLLTTAITAFSQANVLNSPVVIVPVPVNSILASRIAAATPTTNGVAITLQTALSDYLNIVTSEAGALITQTQRERFLFLLEQYKSVDHIDPIPILEPSTNTPIFRLSPASVQLAQFLERLEARNIALALVAPPATNAPSGPPVIVIPSP